MADLAMSRFVTPLLLVVAVGSLIGIGILQRQNEQEREQRDREASAEEASADEGATDDPAEDGEAPATPDQDPVPADADVPQPDAETADSQEERPAGGGDRSPAGGAATGGAPPAPSPIPSPPDSDSGVARDGPVVAGSGRAGGLGSRPGTTPAPVLREFTLRYGEGYSFRQHDVVPAASADFVFRTCAGGTSSVTIEAPGGITNVSEVLNLTDNHADAFAIYQRLRGVSLSTPLVLDDTADGRVVMPAADVFVVRVLGGGWAKVLLIDRKRVGNDWQKWPVRFRYEYVPRGSTFPPAATAPAEKRGLIFEERLPTAWPRSRGAWGKVSPGPASGSLPAASETQELLFCRALHGERAYQYCLASGLRDDRPGNNRSLSYGQGGLYVRSVTDHRSTLTDMGRFTWSETARSTRFPQLLARANVRPVQGGLYFIQTRDSENHFDTLLRVTAYAPGDRVAFEWISLDRGKFRRSPAFTATPVEIAAIERQLTRLSRGGRQFEDRRLPPGAPADTYMRLADLPLTDLELQDARTLGAAIDLLRGAGHKVVLGQGLDDARLASPVRVRGDVHGTTDFLDALTRQLGLGWTIDARGVVLIVQPKAE